MRRGNTEETASAVAFVSVSAGRENSIIVAMNIRIRETSNLQGDEAHGWSKWIWAMAPENTPRENHLERRVNDQVGFVNTNLTDSLRQANPNVAELCGIYEWRATEEYGANPSVVYLGSTCPPARGPRPWRLENRIVAYTKRGNHKKELINYALTRGCELWVRFKPAPVETEAREMENELLRQYNYAWNVRNNGVRPMLAKAVNWLP